MTEPLQILQSYWGHEQFRPNQEQIIHSVLDGKDTVALLPTGGGKSLCFQIPSLAQEGICIVISPLVALINDQVAQLRAKQIKALALVGGLKFDEVRSLLDNALYGNYKFLYLSPERLQQEMVQNAIRQMNVNLIAVDEAHCISQWGNDFRPSYKEINVLKELHPLVPFIALTATATPQVLEDTIEQLRLELPTIFKSSFVRSNLSYQVYKADDKLYHLERLLKANNGSAIVYVRSRSNAASISEQLNSLGLTATFYHGGISKAEKTQRLEDWKNDSIQTMVATNAFGMGIDKSNVRTVIHIQLPESIESYFQEAGRAGRDEQNAIATIIYNDFDKQLVHKQFVASMPTPKQLKELYWRLNNYFQIPYGEGSFVSYSFSFSDFCATYELNTILTYNGLNSLDRLGVIQLSKEYGQRSTIQFMVPTTRLLAYFKTNTLASVVGKTMLRIYGGIFEVPTPVRLKLVAKKTGLSIDEVITVIRQMERDQLLEASIHETDASITFLVPREDEKTINPLSKSVEALNQKKATQVQSVVDYIENEDVCRTQQLVSYFGETTNLTCHVCSVCQRDETSGKNSIKEISAYILKMLKEKDLTSREIVEKSTFAEIEILKVLNLLLDAKKIVLNTKNQYTLDK